ncbi:hypothetical protein L1077_20385 [Pseudoalteromonas luteoviolacea]|uniref:PKD domain-containing protein n=1 Tax=Pseudoalteromonas luteoviolacea TaxID=43657 RepID=UPI001F3F8922|nr:hypothetical protein [Pseudoalteromonas luteoviolacea]MCF6441799.1 hypothetical protein [Pseudoalteromonas luteoviolacea]
MLKRLFGDSVVPKALFLSMLLFGLNACGGSGGSDGTNSVANSGGGAPTEANEAPKVSIEGSTQAEQLVPITLIANASDSDGRIESYQWSFDPALPVSSDDFNSPSFTLVSKEIEQSFTFDVNVTVTDDQGEQAIASKTVEILVPDPITWHLNIDGKDSIQEQSTLQLSLSSDILVDSAAQILWSHDSSLPLMLTENDSGTLSVAIPDISESQVVNFTARVTLSDGRTNEQTHQVMLEAFDNLAPEVKITGEHEVVEGTTSVLVATANDSDGEVVSYSWSHNAEAGVTIIGETTESLSVSFDNIMVDQVVTFTVTVYDNQGATTTVEHSVNLIARANTAPEVSINAVQDAMERQPFTVIASAIDLDGEVVSHAWSHDSSLALTIEGQTSNTLTVVSSDIQSPQNITFTYTATDNQGASASTSTMVTVENVKVAFTVAGKVTDSPIALAKVSMEIADSTFETRADENGDYTLDVEVDEAHSGVLAKLSAQGVDQQSQVSLVSQLQSVAAIKEAAGIDEVVTADELFDVNVTNVTTAEYVLLGRDKQSFSNDSELNQVRARISSQEQLMLAAVIKAVIDHGVTLPDTVNSTLELANDPELVDELVASIAETQPNLIKQLEQEITSDDTLVEAVAFTPNGSYYLVETQYVDGLDYKLSFSPDGTGVLTTADKQETFNWTQTSQTISVQLDSEIFLKSNQFEHVSGFLTSFFTMNMYDHRHKSLAVMVEFYLSDTQAMAEHPADTYSTAAQLFGTADLAGITESELLGTWGLSFSRVSKQDYVELTFKAGGVLKFDIGQFAWVGSWHIEDGQVRLTSQFWNFSLKFIRPFDFGFQTLMEFGTVGAQTYRQGTFVKRQPITFKDIDYQKTWRKVSSKTSHSAFSIDENNNFNFRWHRGIQGDIEDGMLKRYRYQLNGRRVEFCNVALVNCDISGVYSYELLAQVGNTIAVVNVDEKQNFADLQSGIQFFKLSDKTWPLGQFTQSFFNTDKLERLFDAGTHLYSLTQGSVLYLRSELYCPTNPSPIRLCFDSIVFKGERYKASMEGPRLRLEQIGSNDVSYLEITDESEHSIVMCHFSEGASCGQGEQHEFSFAKPELEVTISQTGRGQLTFSQEQLFYGDSFYIEIDEAEGAILANISGCGGYLVDTGTYRRYWVDSLTSSCVIEVEFIDRTAHTQNMLLVDATPAGLTDSWYYTIDADGHGTFYGLDGSTSFTVQKRNANVYDFIFDDIIRTRVNGYNYYASKFALWYSSTSSAMSGCWNGSVDSADIEPGSNGHGLICTKVELAASQPPVEVAVDELVGDWYLNFDQSLTSYQLSLNEDGTGRLQSTDDGAVFNRQVNWQVTAENRFELTDETGMLAAFSVLRKEDSLFTLIAHETDHSDHAPWQMFGTWAMIRTGHQSLGVEQLKGAWFNVDDQNIDGFYLFAGGEYRSGRFNGAASAIMENNVLTVTTGFNTQSGEYDHLCGRAQPECETRIIAQYEVIALDGQRAYIRVLSGSGTSDALSVVEIEPAFAVDLELPAYFNSTKFYEKFNGTTRIWQFEQLEQPYFANLIIDEQSAFTVYYEKGEFWKSPNADGFRYKVQEVNVDALVLCPIVDGQCDVENQIELLFQVPFVEVSLDIPEALEATHNLISSRLKYGEHLEIKLRRNNQQRLYASAFSGCGIRLDWMNDFVVDFQSEPVKKSCMVKMTASPLPESNADRLGISDPVLKACIDRGRNEYIEYDHQLACLNSEAPTSLEGIEKLTSLTSIALRGIALNEEGSKRIGQLTNLTGLIVDMGPFYGGPDNLNLDLSSLINLKSLQLARLPQGHLTLPDTPELKLLSIFDSDITEVDLSGLQNLDYLSIGMTGVTTLDLSNNKRLQTLNAEGSSLQSISGVTPEHLLKNMDLQKTPIETLDLTGYSSLLLLDLSNSQLQEIDISPAVRLQRFTADHSQLQSMLFSSSSNVQEVSITDTPLTELHVGMMPKLNNLNIRRNNLLFLDFSEHTGDIGVYAETGTVSSILLPDNQEIGFTDFSFRGNKIENLVVPAGFTGSLDFDNNQLSQLTVLGSPYSLSAKNNLLESISISSGSEIQDLDLANNKLTSAQLSGKFESVDLSGNQLTVFHLFHNAINRSLSLANNQLSNFTAEGEISLSLNLSHNAFEHLDLPKYNGFGDKLDVSNNPLKSINFNGGDLYTLNLSDTELTELDLSSLSNLAELFINRTNISSIDIPERVRVFAANEVPATSFTIPVNSRVMSISFKKNLLNSIVGLDNLTQRVSMHASYTVVEEALLTELKAHPYVYLSGL